MFNRKLYNAVVRKEYQQIRCIVDCGKKFLCESKTSYFKRNVQTKSNVDEDSGADYIQEYAKSRQGQKRVYVWGMAEHGALGYLLDAKKKKKSRSFFFLPIRLHFAYNHPVVDVACGYGFSLFGVKSIDNKKVFGCGINADSQIGFHDPRRDNPLYLVLRPIPISLPFKNPAKAKILKIAAGRAHSIILSTEGVFMLGNNAYGQCGRPIVDNEDYIKNRMPANIIPKLGEEMICKVYCGQDHSLFVTESGKVFSCGWGADGQTGLGHYQNEWKPSLIKGDISNEKIVKISCAADCVLALNDKGEVFGWGNSEYGQFSDEDGQQQISSPRFVKKTKNLGKIVDIASSGTTCAVLNEDGNVFTWGYGALGHGPKVERNETPTLIPPRLFGTNELQTDSKVVKINCGLAQFAAITNYGNLYMWGRNNWGQLGLGHKKDQYFPLQVSLGAVVKDVSCGVDHTIALSEPFT